METSKPNQIVPSEDFSIVQRDPRLFPIRTPQPPRKPRPSLNSSTFNLVSPPTLGHSYNEDHEFLRSGSGRMRSQTPTGGNRGMQNTPGYDSKRQEQRDESMRRLLEWKQRMLQSPLSRKGSRAQTPVGGVNSSNSYTSTPTGEEDLNSPRLHQRLHRKTSNASRTSRSRSLSRYFIFWRQNSTQTKAYNALITGFRRVHFQPHPQMKVRLFCLILFERVRIFALTLTASLGIP